MMAGVLWDIAGATEMIERAIRRLEHTKVKSQGHITSEALLELRVLFECVHDYFVLNSERMLNMQKMEPSSIDEAQWEADHDETPEVAEGPWNVVGMVGRNG